MKPKRVVVKVGSSSLTDDQGNLSMEKMDALVEQIAALYQEEHCQVVLVSSGAVAAGRSRLSWMRSTNTIPEKQAAAAVGQGLLIERYHQLFQAQEIPIAQLLLTRQDMEHRHRYIHIRNTMETLLSNRILPIINENDTVAVEEIRFGDNDTLSSLVALVCEADCLILMTDIDGLYTANPRECPDAKHIAEVKKVTEDIKQSAGSAGSSVGTGGMHTKLIAAQMAMESGIDVVITSSSVPQALRRICRGEQIGTRFVSTPQLSSRKSWLAYGSKTEGIIRIDEGAVHALLHRAGSLLLAGIESIEGSFHEGAVIKIQSEHGEPIAKGITSFSERDLSVLLERKRQGEQLRDIHAVVHRNNMVVTHREENGSC